MKLLLVLLALWALVWLLRGGRRRGGAAPRPHAAPTEAQPMLRCAQCGLHLPRDEALPGRGGVFCGAEHRAQFEQAQQGR